jgi:hypothetical protein
MADLAVFVVVPRTVVVAGDPAVTAAVHVDDGPDAVRELTTRTVGFERVYSLGHSQKEVGEEDDPEGGSLAPHVRQHAPDTTNLAR